MFIFRLKSAAILNLKVKNRSYHQNNVIFQFLDPKLPENHVLFENVCLTIEKIIYIMANGGHFGFGAPTELARTFERGMGAKFFIYLP